MTTNLKVPSEFLDPEWKQWPLEKLQEAYRVQLMRRPLAKKTCLDVDCPERTGGICNADTNNPKYELKYCQMCRTTTKHEYGLCPIHFKNYTELITKRKDSHENI